MRRCLLVADGVACALQKLPLLRVQHGTEYLGNFLRFVALGAGLQGCLLWQRVEGRQRDGCLVVA